VNQTFYRAYKNESSALLLSTAKKEYGDLLDPMIEIAEAIRNEGAIVPLRQRRGGPQVQPPPPRKPATTVFNSLLVKALLDIDSVLDAWLRIYEYRGPLGLLHYREMSSTPLPLFFPSSENGCVSGCAYKDCFI
jgi:hypothetical protein